MSEQRSYDAVIVGGGVIGLACAWRLAQAGATVAVLERDERPPAGATRVAAGMLAPVGELTFGEPELLELTLAAAELYPDFVAELEAASGRGDRLLGRAAPCTSRSTATRPTQLRRVHDLQRSLGLEAEWLPPRALPRAGAGPDALVDGGVHRAGRGLGRPARAERGPAGGARRGGGRGADRDRGERGACSRASGSPACGPRAGEELRAAAVVLACGAWSGQRRVAARARPPAGAPGQGPDPRAALARDGEPRRCERIVASERVYLVPRPDGRLIVGATVEEQGFDTAVTAGGVHELLREAYRLLPDVAEMELVEAMAGLRPGTPDNLPAGRPRRARGPDPRHRPLPQRHPAGAAGRRPSRRRRPPARGSAGVTDRARTAEAREDRAERRAARAARRDAVARSARRGARRRARGVAVALDGEVVPRGEWDSTRARRGPAAVEVLAAIQGGARDLGAGRPPSGPRG